MDRAKIKRDYARNPHWFVYHPFQRVWNIGAMAIARRLRCLNLLVLLDSLALWTEALARRLKAGSLAPAARIGAADAPRVVYLDLGTHGDAWQVARMLAWYGDRPNLRLYGFEAHPRHTEGLQARYRDHAQVEMINCALVGPGQTGDTIRLYQDGTNGMGDSLFEARGETYVDVPAVRLSRFMAERGIDPNRDVVIVRMNIEGAESYVIEDLQEAGLVDAIDGFYGMWDDVYKIDPDTGAHFRRQLRAAGVNNFPFNDRDLKTPLHGLREGAIRFDLETSIRRGLARKGG